MRVLLGGLVLAVAAAALTACTQDEPEPVPAPARATGSPDTPRSPSSPSSPSKARTGYDEYVALGDSYTAAPLVPPTDTSTVCLRSEVNYPALVTESMPGTELTDVSCSGASTRNTVRPQSGIGGSVPPQFDALRRGTDLVTIGLGGNDEQLFGSLLGTCVQAAPQDPNGSPCTDTAAQGGRDLDAILERIRENLVEVVAGVRERSPRARVLLIGYPQLIPASGTCAELPLATGDYPFARQVNQGLADAVGAAARESGAEFVDVWEPSAGHDICAEEPWINGRVTSSDTALAYHPLAAGQEAVADLVLQTLGGPER